MGKKPAESVTKPIKAKPVPLPGAAPATIAPAAAPATAPVAAAPATATSPAAAPPAAAPAAPAPEPAPEPVIEEIDPNSLLPSAIETKALSKFKVSIDEISAFKSMIDVVSYLVDDLLFAFSKDALHFTAIDSSHVAMLAVTLLKEYFADWQISNPCVFNTQVADFLKIIKRANAADNVSLEYDGKSDSKGDKVAVKYVEVHMSNGKSKRKFKIKGKDIDSGFTNGMEIDQALKFVKGFLEKSNETRVRFKIDVAALGEIVKDAALISDIVTLVGHKDTKTVTFNALGDTGDYEVSMESKDKDSEIRDFKADIDTETIYSLMFIENILKMGNLCTEVTITSMNHGPMLFDFQIIKGKKAVGNLLYLVAPRAHDENMDIEEEGEDETPPDPAAGEGSEEEAGEDEAGEGEPPT